MKQNCHIQSSFFYCDTAVFIENEMEIVGWSDAITVRPFFGQPRKMSYERVKNTFDIVIARVPRIQIYRVCEHHEVKIQTVTKILVLGEHASNRFQLYTHSHHTGINSYLFRLNSKTLLTYDRGIAAVHVLVCMYVLSTLFFLSRVSPIVLMTLNTHSLLIYVNRLCIFTSRSVSLFCPTVLCKK